jgi:hypothetical protein
MKHNCPTFFLTLCFSVLVQSLPCPAPRPHTPSIQIARESCEPGALRRSRLARFRFRWSASAPRLRARPQREKPARSAIRVSTRYLATAIRSSTEKARRRTEGGRACDSHAPKGAANDASDVRRKHARQEDRSQAIGPRSAWAALKARNTSSLRGWS